MIMKRQITIVQYALFVNTADAAIIDMRRFAGGRIYIPGSGVTATGLFFHERLPDVDPPQIVGARDINDAALAIAAIGAGRSYPIPDELYPASGLVITRVGGADGEIITIGLKS